MDSISSSDSSPSTFMDPSVSQPNSEPVNRNKLPETEANVTKRTLQLREAQRVHREKKLRHLKDMEDTIAQLREENKEVQTLRETVKALQFELSLLKGSLTCVVCSVPLTSIVQAGQVDAKLDQAKVCNGVMDTPSSGSESVVTGVSCSPATVSPESDRFDYQMTELDTFLSTVVPKMITSEELYGPLEVDAGRLLIRTIPSLKGSSDPDRMFDLIVEHSRAADFPTAKRIKLKAIRTMTKILQQTSFEDRPALFELLAVIQERNIHHFRYINSFWGTMLPVVPPFLIDPTNKIHRLMLEYQPRFLQIPSLSNSVNEVSEFCFTWARAMDTKEPTAFFRIHICIAKIILLCSVKDRAAFYSLFFQLKDNSHNEMEDVLQKMEAISLH